MASFLDKALHRRARLAARRLADKCENLFETLDLTLDFFEMGLERLLKFRGFRVLGHLGQAFRACFSALYIFLRR
jgi:hypothetical protein